MGEQVNLHLLPQGLTRSILEAICPVQANFGPLPESKDQFGRGDGYRFHSGMVTFSWHCRSIEDRVAGLFPAERIVAEAALEWLRENSGPEQEQSAFGEFRQEHEWLPEKHPRPDDKAAKRWLPFHREGRPRVRAVAASVHAEKAVFDLGQVAKHDPSGKSCASKHTGRKARCTTPGKMKRQNHQQASNATTWRCFSLRFLMWV